MKFKKGEPDSGLPNVEDAPDLELNPPLLGIGEVIFPY